MAEHDVEDTLRAYAGDVLADGDADSTYARHSQYYAAAAERSEAAIRSDDQMATLATLLDDAANFRSALEWSTSTGDMATAARIAGALTWFWMLEGMLDEALSHLAPIIADGALPPRLAARCHWGYALVLASLGRLIAAREIAARGVSLARDVGDEVVYGSCLNALAVAQWALGDHNASAAAHEEAIPLFVAKNDVWGEAICRVLRARTALDAGEPGGAALVAAGLEAARRSCDRHVLGIALEQTARLQLGEGDVVGALRTAASCLENQEAIQYTEGIISAIRGAAHGPRLSD